MNRKTAIALALSLIATHFASAAVPLRWTVETSRLQPAVFDVIRGETLDLEASFNSYGMPLATSNMTAFICWQTNGMASAWWMTNAVTTATVARVRFTPEMDPGAPVIHAFLGLSDSTNQLPSTNYQLPSLSYRAAFTLRFRHGPGAAPNVIDAPQRILDLAHTVVVNPPWPTQADFAATTTVMRAELKDYVDGQIGSAGLVTPQSVTNVVTNVVTKAYVESLGIESGLDTNAVASVITNHVTSGYLAKQTDVTTASAQTLASAISASAAMTNDLRTVYDLNTYYSGWLFSGQGCEPGHRYHVEYDNYDEQWKLYDDSTGSEIDCIEGAPTDTHIDFADITADLVNKSVVGRIATTNEIGDLKSYADETFRTRTDNVCHASSKTPWSFVSIPEGVTFAEDAQPTLGKYEEFYVWRVNDTDGNEWFDETDDPEYFDWFENQNELHLGCMGYYMNYVVLKRTDVATTNQPFVTFDNVQSVTNGLMPKSGGTFSGEVHFDDVAHAHYYFASDFGLRLMDTNGVWILSRIEMNIDNGNLQIMNINDNVQNPQVEITRTKLLGAVTSDNTNRQLSDFGITDAYTKSQSESCATNAATAVVEANLYYASTNLADNVELRLFSGEWVNAEYDGIGTADVILDLTGVPTDKVTDTLMILNCAATGTLTVATSADDCRVIHKKDANPLELKAGLNLLTFSRYRMANGTNEVLVTNNELE